MVEEDFAMAGEVVLFESGGDGLGIEDAGELRDESFSLETLFSVPLRSSYRIGRTG